MTTKLSELMAEFSEEDRKDIGDRVQIHLKAMAAAKRLNDIRRAARKTQGEVARGMGIGQNAVSQMESRDDMQLSTLHRYVESVGCHLELTVVAPNGERVDLKEFKPWNNAGSKNGYAKRASAAAAVPARKTGAAKPKARAGVANARLGAK